LGALLFLVRHKVLFGGSLRLVDVSIALGAWKSINHPLRLINFAALAYILWYLPRSVDEKLHGLSLFRFLRYLGRHSLQVYAWSILVAYTASSFKVSWAALSPAWRMLLAVAAALSLALPAWLHERWRLQRDNISLTIAKAGVPVETPLAAVAPDDLSLPADGEA
jgi:peptidoglycan/LPS O-acetylase OafA/YrhL